MGIDGARRSNCFVRHLVDLHDSANEQRGCVFGTMTIPRTALEWENAFAPYDEATYQAALAALRADDIVLDIGAGDLRFAKCAALRVKRIIAIEQRRELVNTRVPPRVQLICDDARTFDFPHGITSAVLLMRHCQHFALYREKLERVGCQRLITNARWGMDVEVMDLNAARQNFFTATCGWYACKCGAVGFKEGADASIDVVTEMDFCPRCLVD